MKSNEDYTFGKLVMNPLIKCGPTSSSSDLSEQFTQGLQLFFVVVFFRSIYDAAMVFERFLSHGYLNDLKRIYHDIAWYILNVIKMYYIYLSMMFLMLVHHIRYPPLVSHLPSCHFFQPTPIGPVPGAARGGLGWRKSPRKMHFGCFMLLPPAQLRCIWGDLGWYPLVN